LIVAQWPGNGNQAYTINPLFVIMVSLTPDIYVEKGHMKIYKIYADMRKSVLKTKSIPPAKHEELSDVHLSGYECHFLRWISFQEVWFITCITVNMKIKIKK
jgi:hypothetical protein